MDNNNTMQGSRLFPNARVSGSDNPWGAPNLSDYNDHPPLHSRGTSSDRGRPHANQNQVPDAAIPITTMTIGAITNDLLTEIIMAEIPMQEIVH